MSLLRRIHLLITLVLLLVMCGGWLVHVGHSRQLLAERNELQANTLLEQVIRRASHELDQGAWQTAWSLLSNQAEGAALSLAPSNGTTLEKEAEPTAGAPLWFNRLYPLAETTVSRTLVATDGATATLTLRLPATGAERQLWRSGWHFLLVTTAILLLVLAAANWWLTRMVAPLTALGLMARRLGKNETTTPLPLPQVSELRDLVLAFNRMADAIHHFIDELQDRVNLWRKAAFADEETGLANRRAMIDELAQQLTDPQAGHGMLLMIRLNRRGLHAARGFGAVTALWQQLVGELPQLAHGLRHQSYRAREEELALLMPHAAESQVRAFAERLHQWLITHDDEALSEGLGWIGVSLYSAGDPIGQVLAEMDLALEQAATNGRNAWVLHGGQRRLPLALLNVEERKALVTAVVAQRRFSFAQQPVLYCASRQTLYQEWLPQFHDSRGSAVASRTLIALARQFEQLAPLEIAIVEEMASFIRHQHPRPQLSLNLDPMSLLQGDLTRRIEQLCDQDPQLGEHLLIELDERRLIGAIPAITERLAPLVKRGIRLVVDHFGAEHASFTLLTTLRPTFVKLDGRLSLALAQHPDHLLFLQALLPVCSRLGIGVIAAQVEHEIDLHAVEKAGLQLAQGYVFGQPRPLATTVATKI